MRLIFERAGEAAAAAESDRRYSLEEIQEIAIQAGLDPKDIARAAETVRAHPRGGVLLGAPTRFRGSRIVHREMHETDFLETVLKIRERTGLHGELKDVPGGMEWRAHGAMGYYIVDFARTSNGTRIDVVVTRDDQAVITVLFGGMTGIAVGVATAMGVTAGLDVGAAVGLLTATAAAIGSGWGTMRLIWKRIAGHWSREAAELTATVADSMERKL
jgi:hypothetical protein